MDAINPETAVQDRSNSDTNARHTAHGQRRGKDAIDDLAQSAAQWPSILRDIAAASLTLWAVFFGEVLSAIVPLRAEVLLAAPGILAAWWIFGAASAVFGALVGMVVIQVMSADRTETLFTYAASEMAAPAVLGLALLVLCISLHASTARRERCAALLLDACAADAMVRIRAADARVAAAEAEAQVARAESVRARRELEARLQPTSMPRPESTDTWRDAFEDARRREGGI